MASIQNYLHWNYFIALEQDLLKISRFIEFNKANYKTYSIELSHLLLASSSEVDVVMKALCNLLDTSKKHEKVDHYRATIKDRLLMKSALFQGII